MRVLLTSVCRPLGPAHGDASSVGYELLHRQVTRAQGVFSPRATHLTFGLDYIAANLDAPAVVLHYPSRRELVAELRQAPDYVGISFIVATFHHLAEMVRLVREHAPRARIVLGGYGTMLDDATLAPYADHICREEGVGFFRALLGEPPRPMPYDHPVVISRLRVFSLPVSRTGMIFAGLGCPHGCDFCSTSHFFKRRHQRLLPTGDDVFRVIERYLEIDPRMNFTILDEDFLVARDRAARLRELILARGTPVSIFAFATIKALSRISPAELLETGIDGVWVGYEGARSGYAKQEGRSPAELIPELRSHGITVLASMILGFDYQDAEVIRAELAGLLELEPALAQFLIYGAVPGTPLYRRILSEGRLRPELAADPARYYRSCDGFTAMARHPRLAPEEIERLQRECFETDFRVLGPSVVRTIGVWLEGFKRYHDSAVPYLRAKAARWADEIRRAWPILSVAGRSGPRPDLARALAGEVRAALGPPTVASRVVASVAPLAAAWTGFTLGQEWLQHPRLRRNAYRTTAAALRSGDLGPLQVAVERAIDRTRVRLSGALDRTSARLLAKGIRAYLQGTDARIEVVVAEGTRTAPGHLRALGRRLSATRHRISIALPAVPGHWSALATWLETGVLPG